MRHKTAGLADQWDRDSPQLSKYSNLTAGTPGLIKTMQCNTCSHLMQLPTRFHFHDFFGEGVRSMCGHPSLYLPIHCTIQDSETRSGIQFFTVNPNIWSNCFWQRG